MKRWISIIAVAALFIAWACAPAGSGRKTQEDDKTPVVVMFYNVENLFDTIPSPGIYDEEFTPKGKNKWTGHKYWIKINNLERVFYSVASKEKTFPAIIGVSEVENRNVLEDIAATPKLRDANYQIVHYDSPDARGVDVALFYRPDIFEYEGSYPIKTVVPELPDLKTRDVLSVWGKIEGEDFCFFVCHWPSRLGGAAASEFRRVGAAQTIRDAIDSIRDIRPSTRFVVMGDMNDDPNDRSMAEVLGGKREVKKLEPGDMFNPFWQMHRKGIGTLAYGDVWNLFDNIVVSENLVNPGRDELGLYKKNKFYGYIFNEEFLLQQSGQYKGYPLRTYAGGIFRAGYSDHMPVYILLK